MLSFLHVLAASLLGFTAPQELDSISDAVDAPAAGSADELPEAYREMMLSESLVRDLSKRFGPLDRAVYDLDLDAGDHPGVFAERFVFRGLAAPEDDAWTRSPGHRPNLVDWPVDDEPREVASDGHQLLGALTSRVAFFDFAHFKFVRGDFDASGDQWTAQVGFSGKGGLANGNAFGVNGHLEIEFAHRGERDDPLDWRVVRWTVLDMATDVVAHRWFEDVLDEAIDDAELLAALRRSNNHELILAHELEGEPLPEFLFQYAAAEQHPGVTVVDLDRDGWEDVFVMSRWGPTYMLRNRGDGTFEDVAEEVGLAIDGSCTSANFADFDNDGDLDAMVGRYRAPSVYLVNEGGRFVDRTQELVRGPLPGLVSSVSVADYDGDGLLDIYLATYSSVRTRTIHRAMKRGEDDRSLVDAGLVRPKDHTALLGLLEEMTPSDQSFDYPGFTNVLLKNLGGGRFARDERGALDATAGRLCKNTFAASFSDFDGDGDQDLYCSNDFAPDNLYRNDDGVFVDVTVEQIGPEPRFGMGISWGDYDGDGRMDAYVSNMFSKAGNRIISQLEGVDPRLLITAQGNTLYRNLGDRFEVVTETDTTTSKSGWSYGSQFADVDGDGYFDILGLAGHFTAPDALANGDDW